MNLTLIIAHLGVGVAVDLLHQVEVVAWAVLLGRGEEGVVQEEEGVPLAQAEGEAVHLQEREVEEGVRPATQEGVGPHRRTGWAGPLGSRFRHPR